MNLTRFRIAHAGALFFHAAANDAAGAGGTPAADEVPKMQVDLAITPELLAALGVPADQATPESVLAAAKSLSEKSANADTLTAQLAGVTAERDAATAKLGEIEQAATMAEVDALLADYELPAEAVQPMRDLAVSNRDQAKALLTAMPKKGAAAAADEKAKPATENPPPPIHDPAAEAKPATDPATKAKDADALIAAVRKEGKFKDYSGAREEARRRQPELFA